MSEPLYRKSVGICLFNHEGKVFIAERVDTKDAWQMPQGGVDENEDLSPALFREMKEEIGTDKAQIIARAPHLLRYDFPESLQSMRKIFKGKYKGQEQTWFALLYEGEDSDIDLSAGHTGEPAEFGAWRWADISEVSGLIVDFKKPVYEEVAALFTPIAEALKQGKDIPEITQ